MGTAGGGVTVSTRAQKDGAELRVRDTGPGMTDEVLRRLFEPYRSTRPGGSGLGLAIARRIVLDHGGRIEAENRPEGGAEVRVFVPSAAAPPAGTAGDGAPVAAPGSKEVKWEPS